jgi:hypothetical protein
MTQDQSDEIEHLLGEWYDWQCRQSHAEVLSHFYRPVDMTCKRYQTPTTDAEDDESAYQWADDRQSQQVQLCVDELTAEQRAAISISLCNKASGAQVWKSGRVGDQHAVYQSAKGDLFPMLIARGLIQLREAA